MRPRTLLRTGAALLLALATCAPAASALTKLEGDYQLMMDLRKNDRTYLWEFDSNSGDVYNGIDFRLWSQMAPGLESFVKFQAAYNNPSDNYPQPQFQYSDAFLRFRKEFGKRGFDSYVFSREDRLSGINSYLIPWASPRGDAQGVRVDTWGFGKTNATFIVADQSSAFNLTGVPYYSLDSTAQQRALRTGDEYIARLRRDFLKDNALRLGLTYTRFEGWAGVDSTSGASAWTSVLGFDSRLRVKGADVAFEYGESRDDAPHPGAFHPSEITVGRNSLGFRLPYRAVTQAEIRSIKLGTPGLGFINIVPGWWSHGPEYTDYVGGPGSDRTGFYLNSWYLMPERAITISNSISQDSPSAQREIGNRSYYTEMYIEFINGFTGKTAYKITDTYAYLGPNVSQTQVKDWYNDLQVESKLAKMHVQTKLHNIGTPDETQVFVLETTFNLSSTTKFYNRFAFGNDPSILRKGLFVQLQYRPAGNTEMYLQYGPDYIGGGSMPVDEGNLNGGADQKDIVKFILKGSF